MATEVARLRERAVDFMGMVRMWSAAVATDSGTPADSRPKRRMSLGR